ncbi:MAG: glycosyltransferase, partial [Puniceicoccales bacterium]
MKRVLIMSTLYPPYVVGGAELSTQQIAEEMARDYEVSVITSSPDKNTHREQMNGVTVYRVPARNVGSWKRPADTKFKTALFHIGENYNFPREAQ